MKASTSFAWIWDLLLFFISFYWVSRFAPTLGSSLGLTSTGESGIVVPWVVSLGDLLLIIFVPVAFLFGLFAANWTHIRPSVRILWGVIILAAIGVNTAHYVYTDHLSSNSITIWGRLGESARFTLFYGLATLVPTTLGIGLREMFRRAQEQGTRWRIAKIIGCTIVALLYALTALLLVVAIAVGHL